MRYFSAYALSLKKHLSCGHGVYAYYGAADRGFAAARFTHKAERFALVYVKAYALHGNEVLPLAAEGNLHIAHAYKRLVRFYVFLASGRYARLLDAAYVLYLLGRLYLGRARVKQPCARLMRRGNVKIRRPVFKVYIQRIRIARGERIAANFLEQVRRRALY